MNKITENTLIPVSLVILLLGGIVWLTSIYAQASQAAEAVKALTFKQEDYNRLIENIDRRLSRIEGKLGVRSEEK